MPDSLPIELGYVLPSMRAIEILERLKHVRGLPKEIHDPLGLHTLGKSALDHSWKAIERIYGVVQREIRGRMSQSTLAHII